MRQKSGLVVWIGDAPTNGHASAAPRPDRPRSGDGRRRLRGERRVRAVCPGIDAEPDELDAAVILPTDTPSPVPTLPWTGFTPTPAPTGSPAPTASLAPTPTPAPSPRYDPPPKRGPFEMNLYHRGDFATQVTKIYCVPGAMQTMMNVMDSGATKASKRVQGTASIGWPADCRPIGCAA